MVMNASGMSDGRVCRWHLDGKYQIDIHRPRSHYLSTQDGVCVNCGLDIYLGDDGFWYLLWSPMMVPKVFLIQEEPW